MTTCGARLAQHTGDWYAALRMQKLPVDLELHGVTSSPSGWRQRQED